MARIAGINIPDQKHTVIALTSIFGIGKTRSKAICASTGIAENVKIRELSEELECPPLREGEAFDPSLLAGYLQTQYRDFFQLAPKAQKRTRRLVGPNAWGYWALEVAAMAVVYGGDDAVLRTCPHYPSDLVDYARR